MLPSAQRFSDRVDFYVRARPKYPPALLNFFQSELKLSREDAIADIGSGTGILTEIFVRNGNQVYAVEPNAPMRHAAENQLGSFPNFHSITGTAEDTTMQDTSVNFVTAAQAFHWFAPIRARAEFQRILKPGGTVALIWNERKHDSPFMQAYDQLIEKYRIESRTARLDLSDPDGERNIQKFFAPDGHRSVTMENPQTLDRVGLIDRMISSSYMPLPTDPRHAGMLSDTQTLFDEHCENETVHIQQETRIYYGQLHK
jgi:ubiquinone/menaquinone biosynthesis C-methylase UbiE